MTEGITEDDVQRVAGDPVECALAPDLAAEVITVLRDELTKAQTRIKELEAAIFQATSEIAEGLAAAAALAPQYAPDDVCVNGCKYPPHTDAGARCYATCPTLPWPDDQQANTDG